MDSSPQETLREAGITWRPLNGGKEARFPCPCCANDEGFGLNLKTGLWGCLRASCGKHGNLYQLRCLLGLAYQVQAPAQPTTHEARNAARPFQAKETVDFRRWNEVLWSSNHAGAAATRDYLAERGFSRLVIDLACLGWAPRHPGDTRAGQVVGNGMVAIPYFTGDDATLVKLRWVPPEPEDDKGKPIRYARVAGGKSSLYAPVGIPEGRTVLVCGGEMDCLSILEAAREARLLEVADGPRWLEIVPVSIPDGEGSWSESFTEQLGAVEDIVLCYDSDTAGEAGAKKAAEAIGAFRVRIGHWPEGHKDGNAALVAGALDWGAVGRIIEEAKSPAGSQIVSTKDLEASVLSQLFGAQPRGWPTGWAGLDELFGGWRQGEVTIVTGPTGSGKTTLAYQAALYQAQQGRRVLVCPFEGGPTFAAIRFVRQLLGGDPETYGEGRVREALAEIRSSVFFFDHVGAVECRRYAATMEYCIKSLGIDFVVVDHLHFMTRRADKDRWDQQDQIVMDSQMTIQRSGAHMLLLAHSAANKPKTKDKDDVITQLSDIKGHTEVFQDTANAISVYRPRTNDREDMRDQSTGLYPAAVVVIKTRMEYGREGLVELSFDKPRGRFLDKSQNQQPETNRSRTEPSSDDVTWSMPL